MEIHPRLERGGEAVDAEEFADRLSRSADVELGEIPAAAPASTQLAVRGNADEEKPAAPRETPAHAVWARHQLPTAFAQRIAIATACQSTHAPKMNVKNSAT